MATLIDLQSWYRKGERNNERTEELPRLFRDLGAYCFDSLNSSDTDFFAKKSCRQYLGKWLIDGGNKSFYRFLIFHCMQSILNDRKMDALGNRILWKIHWCKRSSNFL